MYLLNNTKFNIDIQHTFNNVNYPANWFHDKSNRDAIGIVEVIDPIRPNDDLYIVTENEDGTFNSTPRDHLDIVYIVKKRLTDVVSNYLDSVAIDKGYDSILSACSYAAAPNPYQIESQLFISWRGVVWAKFYDILNQITTKVINIPTEEELLKLLPILTF